MVAGGGKAARDEVDRRRRGRVRRLLAAVARRLAVDQLLPRVLATHVRLLLRAHRRACPVVRQLVHEPVHLRVRLVALPPRVPPTSVAGLRRALTPSSTDQAHASSASLRGDAVAAMRKS